MSKLENSEVFVEYSQEQKENGGDPGAGNSTADPHDPLTWSSTRKLAILTSVSVYMFVGTFSMIVIGPALQIVPREFHSAFSASTYLIGGPLLAYGVASFLWVPLANRYGARLIFTTTSIVGACLSIWGARATSFGSLVAARTLATGLFASPETLAPQMIGDVFAPKDRAKAMTVIAIMQAVGFSVGPLAGSFIVQNSSLGWRWTEWIIVILAFSSAAMILLLMPETQYTNNPDRRPRRRIDDFRFWPVSGGGKRKVHRYRQARRSRRQELIICPSLRAAFAVIFPYFFHPIVITSMVFFSICLMVANYTMTTQSLSYQIEYGFSLGDSGLTFFAPMVGSLLAIILCGVLADHYFQRLARKSQGKPPKPERRLPLFALTGPVGVAGTILFGVCTQNQCHWFAPLFGTFLLLFSFTSAASILFAYLLDVYEARMDTVMVVFNGVKNIATFAISYAIIPWNTSAGYSIPFIVLGLLLLAGHLLVGLIYWKGEAMRHWTATKFESGKETHHGDAF
ncbi:uncharacterized protein A1O5_12306 [Cladophialophora psammophila CBS 110553]|uniref:Major facilitator superfamily (MFS) profile domain-containing protein n=1 Tax=Cladophialophora psammophila CBS 110553 TaxID=1182543 RepID=W9W351_9EURO|nr:uncharacterized protein A1O5_12306 [Cladophialophora psammophila CBS 110553]EXJ59425.1 hypothetical protein A1O5_12306 [Cladophialophora psammophila CBS 110553]